VRALKAELDAAGIRSKHRTFADGTVYGGHKLSRGALYLMLQNRIYRGEITHKGSAYPGEHKAIVDQALWDKVQAVLVENRVNRNTAQTMNAWSGAPSNAMTAGFRAVQERAIGFAKENAEGSFALASELANAKDMQEVLTLQSRYAQTQIQTYAHQVQELGRLMSEAIRDMQVKG